MLVAYDMWASGGIGRRAGLRNSNPVFDFPSVYAVLLLTPHFPYGSIRTHTGHETSIKDRISLPVCYTGIGAHGEHVHDPRDTALTPDPFLIAVLEPGTLLLRFSDLAVLRVSWLKRRIMRMTVGPSNQPVIRHSCVVLGVIGG